jgi:hypothetical protein
MAPAAGSYSLRKDLAEEWDACAGDRVAGGTMGRDTRGLDRFVDQVRCSPRPYAFLGGVGTAMVLSSMRCK